MQAGRLPSRIIDLLECDGGWLTTAGVAEDLSAVEDSAKRALIRLRDRGLIESRQVVLAFAAHNGGKYDTYTEWRLA